MWVGRVLEGPPSSWGRSHGWRVGSGCERPQVLLCGPFHGLLECLRESEKVGKKITKVIKIYIYIYEMCFKNRVFFLQDDSRF